MAKGVRLGALVGRVDPSLRWGDGVRVVVGPRLRPQSEGFGLVVWAVLMRGG
jgi:hypothetical protein